LPGPKIAPSDHCWRHNYWRRADSQEALKFAQVRLYVSSGTAAWSGRTDKNGSFAINKMLPGVYRLEVSGWMTTVVQLKPELNKGPFGQTPAWNLMLIDKACVAVTEILS